MTVRRDFDRTSPWRDRVAPPDGRGDAARGAVGVRPPPRRRPSLLGRSVLAVSLALAVGACVSTPVRPDVAIAEARAAARAGERGAQLRVARLVARYGPRAAGYDVGLEAARRAPEPEARAWEALFLDALGRDGEAFSAWLALLDLAEAPPMLAAAAASALEGLVDRVPLGPTEVAADAPDPVPSLQRALRRPGRVGALAAKALTAVAARVAVDDPARADALAAAARDRLGAISRYRIVGPRDERPALGRPDPLELPPLAPGGREGRAPGGGWIDCARTGAVGLPPSAHGVYSVVVEVPDRGRLEVEVVGDVAARIYVGGQLAASHPRLTAPIGERLSAVVDAPPGGLLEVQLAARAFPSPVHINVRQADPAADGEPASPLLQRFLGLDAALRDADPQAIADALDGHASGARGFDPAVPLDALWMARAALADPGRPAALGRSQATGHLLAVLAAAPELAAARAALTELLLDEGDQARARAVAAAGPLADHADRLAVQLALVSGLSARAPAEALRARLPRSCEAVGRWLDASWERQRLRGAPFDALPRCFELQLRGAMLLHGAWQLDRARALLDDVIARAAPGAQLGRALLARSRLALARGELDDAALDAHAARRAGAEPEQALELLLRAALLAGDDDARRRVEVALRETPGVSGLGRRSALEPSRDLGLPLVDGLGVARSVERADTEEEADASGGIEVLLLDRHTRVYPDGGMLHREHRILWLRTSAAVDGFGEIALPDEAEVLVARTWKPIDGGGWQPIEPEDLIEKTSISLPALERGAIAEIAWFWYEPPTARMAPGWRTPVFSFASPRGPTRLARWEVDAPPDAPLEVVRIAGGPEPSRPTPGQLVFEARDLSRVLPEPLDPRPDRRIPGALVSSGFEPERLVQRMADDAATALAPAPSLSALADEALDGLNAGSDVVRLQALHAFVVSQIRDVDESPLAGRAAFAAARRAGERASLLTALARAAGLDADLVLVRPLAYGRPDPSIFEPENYLYPVVRARIDGREVWLDIVNRFAPFDFLPPLVQSCRALAFTPGGGERVVTPRTEAREGAREIAISITVGPGAQTYTARGDERISGVYAMSWRQALLDMAPDRRDAVLGAIAQQSLPGARIERVETSPLDRRGEPLRVRWEARGRLSEQGPGRAALTLALAPERLEQGTVLVPERTTPMLVNRAVRLAVEASVRLPEGVELRHPPEPVTVEHALMSLARVADRSEDGRRLTLRKRFELAAGVVPPEAYGAWKDAVRAVDRADVVHLVLDVVPNIGGAGAPSDADEAAAAMTR